MASRMQIERIGKEMTCPICLEFSGEPMSIKCGHSFCHRCISELWSKGLSSCPECRTCFQQEDIRPNRQLGNLVESLKPVVKLMEGLCERHRTALRLFIEEKGKAVCAICHWFWEHNGHHTDPFEEAAETHKVVRNTQGRDGRILPQPETILVKMKSSHPIPGLKEILRTSSADVTLDPDTAHPTLFLKDNQRSVCHADTPQDLHDTVKRFDNSFNILGVQRFTEGKHYWEVSVAGKTHWDLGVCRDSVSRKGMVTLCPHKGFWVMILRNGNEYQACTSPATCLSPTVPPQKIGVFLDYEAGNVLFFNITVQSHIFTFSGCTFSGPVCPFFSPGPNYKGENLAPLTICLVSGED
ncbi:E3 ubiquitin-protein ligase TRIM21-like [Tachyglossus aculeatus]|uniref:E3 ubiquitin-protein ligase TRIM21-like n=1 Tax=Tachyglossus aculeatus TaxID=9261 RepID=UPI0018F5AD24|nr:E3 ubiquitin-protein ligase TRIM21-like [Tachyglossus aculeatus]